MIREAEYNTIGHLQDLLNEQIKIAERYKRDIFKPQNNVGQGK